MNELRNVFSRIIILLICLGFYEYSFADTSVSDSLEFRLRFAQADTQRVSLYNQLAWEYKDQNLEQAEQFVNQAIDLAKQTKYRKGMAIGYKIKGVISLYQSEMDEAKHFLQEASLQFEILQDKAEKANTLNNLGMYWQMAGNNKEALAHFEAAAAIREAIGDQVSIANSCNNLGVMYYFMGSYEKALESHLKALKIWQAIGNDKQASSSYLNVGSVYRVLEEDEEALVYFQEGLSIAEKTGDFRAMADAYANIGDVNLTKQIYTEALRNYVESLGIREHLSDQTGIRESLSSIGEVHAAQGNDQDAINYFKRALHISDNIGDKNGMVEQYNLLGQALIRLNQFDLAQSYLEQGVQHAQELELHAELATAYQALTSIEVAKKDFTDAYKYQRLYMDTKNDIFSTEKTKAMLEMESKYESEVKQREIDLLKKDKAIFELQRTRLVFISFTMMLAGMAGFLFFRYRIQTRTNRVLENQKQEIETRNLALEISNRDLEQFAFVVSHDLKQPLRSIGSFAGLLSRRYKETLGEEGEEFIGYVIDGANRMHSLLSDLLTYSQAGQQEHEDWVDLNQIVGISLKNLNQQVKEQNALISVEDLPTIEGNQTGMIQVFQNLISNAIKFQGDHTPIIDIEYDDMGTHHQIAIRDNGIGMESTHLSKIFTVFQRLHTPDKYSGTGIGLSICQKVVKQHGGDIWVDSVLGEGSTFFISMPKAKVFA